jgi:hypothetical protein
MPSVVFIVQCLCPQRHAICAIAKQVFGPDPAKPPAELLAAIEDELRASVDEQIEHGTPALNPWCGLCGARRQTWTFEARATKYETMDQALPDLMQSADAQAALARFKQAVDRLNKADPEELRRSFETYQRLQNLHRDN